MMTRLLIALAILPLGAAYAQTSSHFADENTIFRADVDAFFARKLDTSGGMASNLQMGQGVTANAGGNGSTSPYSIANPTTNSTWVTCPTNSPTVLALHCIEAHTPVLPGGSIFQEFPLTVSLYSDQGLPNNPVAGYFQTWAAAGSAQAWAINPLVHCAPNSNGCIGDETDVNNFDCDPGPAGGTPPAGCAKSFIGKLITGVAGYNLGTAIDISVVGAPAHGWHTGLSSVGLGVVQDSFLYEDDGATRGWYLQGPHALGLDFSLASFSNAAIYLPQTGVNSIVWANTSGHAYIGTDMSGNIMIGSVANTEIASPLIFNNVTADTNHPAVQDRTGGELVISNTLMATNTQFPDSFGPAWPVSTGALGSINECYWQHRVSTQKLYWTCAGVNLMSISDSTGNVIFKGTMTTGTP